MVYRKCDPKTVLATDADNFGKQSVRDAFVAGLDQSLRGEVEQGLKQLVAEVAACSTVGNKGREKHLSTAPVETEPWADPVELGDLLDDLVQHLEKYVALPEHAPEALALWVCHTYVTDVTDYTPYVLVTSPVRECGKSTLLEVLYHLACRAAITGGITAAALYRRIDRFKPSILLDELDSRLRGDAGEALRGVLNTGFHREGKITICVGDDHDDRDFSTFCPKVLAGIGRVWDTVTSRSIPVRLQRASKGERDKLTKVRGDRIGQISGPLQQKLRRWSDDALEQLRDTEPTMPEALGARQCDVWRPLLAIAELAGDTWALRGRETALGLYGVAEEEGDYGLLILQDLHGLFTADKGAEALFTKQILANLHERVDRPWPEYKNDRPITERGLARLVKRFGIQPGTVRVGLETAKGYKLEEFQKAFQTYLPITPELSVTSVTKSEEGVVTDVTDRKAGVGDENYEQDERAGMQEDR